MDLKNAYAGKRILVTGHTGFKGGWLTMWLKRLGAEVTGVALAPETPFFESCGIAGDCRSLIADIRDYDAVARLTAEARPDVVFHLAAQALVGRAYDVPRETMDTNVMGTVNVMEAARRAGSAPAMVVVTTDKVYDNIGEPHPYKESDRLGGRDPYSASKGAAEIVFNSYRLSFLADAGVRAASARSGNVIGGGDWAAQRLVPDLVRAVESGRPLVLRRPAAVRPWQHVLEPLRGYLLLGARLLAGECEGSWNFGPRLSDAATVRDVISRMRRHWPEIDVREEPATATFHEEDMLLLDNGMAERELDWLPRIGLDDGIRLTAEWYRAYLDDPSSVRALTLAQIDAFGG